MKNLVFAALIIAVFMSGCIAPPAPEEVPNDFEFEYGTGAMQLKWGQFWLNVDNEGNAVFTKTMNLSLEKEYTFSLSKEEMKNIYDTAVSNDFFGLEEMYSDPAIMDGGWSELTITADGSTKTVKTENFSHPGFDTIETEISALIVSKIGAGAFSFDDLEAECPAKRTECGGSEDPICSEWSALCDWSETGEINSSYCGPAINRQECLAYCTENECEEELCDTLLFEAEGCLECGPGCCSLCTGLDECGGEGYCKITWIHPAGESWQYSACENANACETSEEICTYLLNTYQGYRYASTIEQDATKEGEYNSFANDLQDLYNTGCN